MADDTNASVEETQRLQRFYERFRQDTINSIARDTNHDWLMQNIRFAVQYPEQLWLNNARRMSGEQLEMHLKDLWWRTIEAAKLYPADDEARQYKLVAWIAGAKARAPVASTQQDPYVADNGKIMWKDLPFFRGVLESAWADRNRLSKEEWRNLNAFVSRLVAVTGIDLMGLGLQTIREALEESRPSFAASSGDQHQGRPVADLLPAAILWLKHTHLFMQTMTIVIERAVKDGVEPPPDLASDVAPGELALADGVSRGGLSLARRRFWRLRLLEIGRETGHEEGDDDNATPRVAHEWARKLGTWNLGWPSELRDVPGWEEPIRYQDSA